MKKPVRTNSNPGPSQYPNIYDRVHIFKPHFSEVYIKIILKYILMTKPRSIPPKEVK